MIVDPGGGQRKLISAVASQQIIPSHIGSDHSVAGSSSVSIEGKGSPWILASNARKR